MALLRDTSKNGKAVEPQSLPQAPEFYANTIVVNASAFEFELQHLLIDSQKNVKAAVTFGCRRRRPGRSGRHSVSRLSNTKS